MWELQDVDSTFLRNTRTSAACSMKAERGFAMQTLQKGVPRMEHGPASFNIFTTPLLLLRPVSTLHDRSRSNDVFYQRAFHQPPRYGSRWSRLWDRSLPVCPSADRRAQACPAQAYNIERPSLHRSPGGAISSKGGTSFIGRPPACTAFRASSIVS